MSNFIRTTALAALATWITHAPLLAQQPPRPSFVVDGGGEDTFVLITGMIGGVAGFRRLEALLLGRGYRVIIVDPYALSLDSADVSFAAMARRVDAVLADQHVLNARVVAHDHGAGVALRLAAIDPERVVALYFLDSGALAANHGPTLSTSLRLVPLITRLPGGRGLVRSRFIAAVRQNAGHQEWFDTATQRAYTEPVLASIDRAVAMAFRLASSEEPLPLSRVVADVRAPITVILGAAPHEADAGPGELTALAPLGKHVRIVALPGVGHFPQEEAPAELLPLILAPLRPFAETMTAATSLDR